MVLRVHLITFILFVIIVTATPIVLTAGRGEYEPSLTGDSP